ncbi:hypothetical protein BS78_05G203400 [Paspalum vaginatum]|nr:hypothetical protein BS78_05G203400 [Paspalum vaginatum]
MDLVVGASNDAVKILVSKLGSLLAQEYTLIRGVRDDIQYINDELASMQAFLTKLKRAPSDHDEQRQDWMKQVREVAYDIEDGVDQAVHRLDSETRGSGMLMQVRRAWYLITTLYGRRCIATEIGNLTVRAQHVSEQRTRYGVENLGELEASAGAEAKAPRDRPAPPPQLIGTMAPVGIEAAMEKLKPWFDDDGTQLKFLAIFGFGGLGKTTLAMALYREFGDKFTLRASVLASQKFHLQTVLRSIIKELHEKMSIASKNYLDGIEERGEQQLKNKLHEHLQETKYLILIDDIWSVSAWESIRDSFTNNGKGGRIVVTTRFISVAEACRRQQHGDIYKHEPLLEEGSCKLFQQVFSSTGYEVSPSKPDGESIMKICGGLPLAILVVAGFVASKLKPDKIDKKEVHDHLHNLDMGLSQELENNLTTEGVAHILSYCYDRLPADLKTCLLYLSMFPKGCLINRKRLVRRWIAEGNLVRAVNNSSNGKVKSCQIHDMVLEYIVAKSSDENFITIVGGHWQTPFPTYKVRRLSIHKSDRKEKDTVERMKLSHVRSLTALGSFRALHSTLLKFQILQVLDLEGCKDLSSNHLKKICEMHQLKYLSLRRTDIERIPKKIGRLEYLEVLDIRETNVKKCPASVERLQRMTHLLAGDKRKRIALKLIVEITKMTALQALCGVNVCCGLALKALENLTNLKKLTVYKVEGFIDGDNQLLLSAIEHLSSCSLKFLAIDDDFTGFLDSSLKDSQAPPEHLHTLGLSGMLSQMPKWIESMHNLEKLTVSLTSLTTKGLVALSGLPELFSLIFSLDSTKINTNVLKILHDNTHKSGGKIFVPAGGFGKLKLLRFAAPVLPPLSFQEGAMPELQRIELRFRMVEGVYGLENLASIRQVVLIVSNKAPEDAKAKATQVKELASMIDEKVNVVLDEYNESAE